MLTDQAGRRTSYDYNARGQVLTAQSPEVAYSYGYDAALRLAARCRKLDETFARVCLLEQQLIRDDPELLAYEAVQLEPGYEGLILRDVLGAYKHGRSTVNEGGMLKLKRGTVSPFRTPKIRAVENAFLGSRCYSCQRTRVGNPFSTACQL